MTYNHQIKKSCKSFNPINDSSDNLHDGEIKVETKEGEGCTFIIQLPNT